MARSKADRAEMRFKQLCCLGIGGEAVMPALVKELRAIVPSHGATFFFADEKMRLANAYTDFSDPYYDRLYFEHFHARPGREFAGTFPDAIRTEYGVRDTEQITAFAGIDVKTFHRSEHWNEVHRPQGLYQKLRLYVHEEGRGRGLGSLTLHRAGRDPAWSLDDKRRLLRLEPFFAQALKGRRPGDDTPLAENGETGLIVVNPAGTPVHFSAEAKRLLFFASFDRVAPKTDLSRINLLPMPLARMCRDLSRVGAGDGTASAPTYHCRNVWGGFTFTAYWLTGEDAASGWIGISVSHQEPAAVRLVRRIGTMPLSRRQAQVCLLMAEGKDYTTIASKLDISKHTAIAHGRWIYNKLDVHNRTELVDKLLSVPVD